MIKTLSLNKELKSYLKKYRLEKKWEKSHFLLIENMNHPGLHVELLEPKHRKIYSFRLDKKYRGIFIFQEPNIIEIIAFTKHYE